MEKSFSISPTNTYLKEILQYQVDTKTKPIGALGQLEDIAIQIGMIQHTLNPRLVKPHILVFAGDHGIANEKVSAYPQEVTWQMVKNFLRGGAAINIFCNQNGIDLKVVDAGVNYDFLEAETGLIHNKIGKGTSNFLKESAMSIKEAETCISTAADLVKSIIGTGCNVIGFGDIGIGNTSSASMVMSNVCELPLENCVGRGTGLSEVAFIHKLNVLNKALARGGRTSVPIEALARYGGFEIAQMVGGILQAAECGAIVLIDGFIASTACFVAQLIEPSVKEYCLFCHQSAEYGHETLLQYLNVNPLLRLKMRLGEGTGVAIAFPIIQSAVNFLNEMASFESAGIQTKFDFNDFEK
jgi:nicotinate-nucleotide--dimethylbenzimidazole phosphoribosyltransferase